MIVSRKTLRWALLALLVASPLAAQQPDKEVRQRCWGTDPDAPVVIEVFSDFSCPACRQLYLNTMRAVMADYALAGKACVVYYEFPLRGNKYSPEAAKYARASTQLGPFKWVKVMDALFTYQRRWTTDGDIEPVVAGALSQEEMEKVRRWLDDPQLEAAINRDVAEGRDRNVQRTPTLFITANGETKQFTGAIQYGIFRRYLESLLARR